MTALLAIVRSVHDARLALEAGADEVAIAGVDGQDQAVGVGFAQAGPILPSSQLEPARAVRAAAEAGFGRVWLPLGSGSGSAVAAAIGYGLTVTAILPFGRRLHADVVDEAAALGVSSLLVAEAPFSEDRVLDAFSVADLAGFASFCRARGFAVGFAGGVEPPDVPRLLALDPAVIGLDRALRDENDRFAPALLRAVRSLWVQARPLSAPPPHHALDRIFVRDRVVTMSVGAYARERQALQRVRFTVEAEIEPAGSSAAGLAGVVSYDLITDAIDRLASGHVELVETLAEDLAAAVLGHPRVATVAITVEKLDVGPGSVGCHITRRRMR